MTPTKERLKYLLDNCGEQGTAYGQDGGDPEDIDLHGLVRLALSALEPKGQALPELWSEEKMQVCLEIGGIHGALGHIRALQRHILSAKAVEWRKVREALEADRRALNMLYSHLGVNENKKLLMDALALNKQALSLLPAEEGEPDAKV